jgi:arylsulfatase A-like enzyme/Flp pilus assembly protein TadD
MPRGKSALTLVTLAAICSGVAVWRLVGAEQSQFDACNILLISIDTCRADHLGCYGEARPLTPNIDKLAADGVRFENVVTSAPLTLPAHCSMLTGRNPPQHGVHDNLDYQCGEDQVTLAEVLRDSGFDTAALVSAFVLDSRFGLDQGFDHYDDAFGDAHLIGNMSERPGNEATQRAREWLRSHSENRFFYFLHYYDLHFDYRAPEPFASQYKDDPYAAEVAYVDRCIGEVIQELKNLDLYDSTLIVVTADHGEMKGEHGELGHSYFIYQGAVSVPLIIKLPGKPASPGKASQQLAGLIDIVPTVCGVAGIPLNSEVEGMDLSPFLLGNAPAQERYVYCESLTPTKYDANSLLGVVGDGWKFIQTTRPELYELSRDAEESSDLFTAAVHQAEMLKSELVHFLEKAMTSDAASGGVDPEARRRLESLGYVGGAKVAEDFTFDQSKEDPKDALRWHHAYDRVQTLFFQDDLLAAKAICEDVLTKKPNLFLFHYSLARIDYRLKEFGTSAEHFRQADLLKEDSPEVKHELGLALRDGGRLPEAIEFLREAVELRPDFAAAHADLGVALAASNRSKDAIEAYERSLRIAPDVATTHNNLGVALAAAARWRDAIERYVRAVELKEDYYEAHANLGIAYANAGDMLRAVEHYRKATLIAPKEVAARVNLGSALESSGDLDDALAEYLVASSIAPDAAELHTRIGKLHRRLGRTEKALESFQLAARLADDSPLAHYDLANAYVSMKQAEEALVHYQRCVRLDPSFAMGRINLGNVLASLRRYDEAVEHFEAAIKIDPQASNAFYNLAACRMAQGSIAEAVASYEHYLQLKPDAVDVLNSLGWIWATHWDATIRNPVKAIDVAERAAKLSMKQDPAVLDTLAAAYAANGDFATAQETIRRAILASKGTAHAHLNETLRQHLALFEKREAVTDFLPAEGVGE